MRFDQVADIYLYTAENLFRQIPVLSKYKRFYIGQSSSQIHKIVNV